MLEPLDEATLVQPGKTPRYEVRIHLPFIDTKKLHEVGEPIFRKGSLRDDDSTHRLGRPTPRPLDKNIRCSDVETDRTFC